VLYGEGLKELEGNAPPNKEHGGSKLYWDNVPVSAARICITTIDVGNDAAVISKSYKKRYYQLQLISGGDANMMRRMAQGVSKGSVHIEDCSIKGETLMNAYTGHNQVHGNLLIGMHGEQGPNSRCVKETADAPKELPVFSTVVG
jgi:hypothetical protein